MNIRHFSKKCTLDTRRKKTYYISMKKKILLIIVSILLVSLLAFSLSACIKLGLKEDAVMDKLTENGYLIKHGKTDVPLDLDKLSKLSIESCFTAYVEKIDENENVVTVNKLYVYYLSDTQSADELESMINGATISTTVDEQEKEIPFIDYLAQTLGKRCSYYRNDQVILLGDFESIALIRSY